MSDLRAAALQALEALEQDNPAGRSATIIALRAALEQPEQEPVAECIDDICSEHSGRVEAFDHLKPGTKLYAVPTPPARQPAQEPVGIVTGKLGTRVSLEAPTLKKGDKVYAAPPVREPLTEDEIERLIQTYSGYCRDDFAGDHRALPLYTSPPARKPAQEPVAYVTTNEDGDYSMLFFDRDEALTYCHDDEEPIALYAAQAVAAEREACADICDQHASVEGIAQRCAAAIRARSKE